MGNSDFEQKMNGFNESKKLTGAVLVVGGGVGGIQAALDLAESGFKVYIVEKSASIGGAMTRLDKTFPTNDCSMCILSPKMIDCSRHKNIELLTYSEVQEVTGIVGDFKVKVIKKPRFINEEKCTGCGQCTQKCPVKVPNEYEFGMSKRAAINILFPQAIPLIATIDKENCLYFTKGVCKICQKFCQADAINFEQKPEEFTLNVGAIILAPGVEWFDPKFKSEYGYGRYPNVVTSIEFERILSASGPFGGRVHRPSDGNIPTKVAFIQCVGSRDTSIGNGYCSAVCCMYATKEAVIAKEHVKNIEPTIFYMDIRAYGKDFDKYVERAQKEYGVRYIRCGASFNEENPETHDITINYETEDGQLRQEEFNLVVLSIGLDQSKTVQKLAGKIGIKLNEYGFCITKEFSPVETSKPGIFVCGVFSSPKDIPDTVTHASAAAASASSTLSSVRGRLVNKEKHYDEIAVQGQPPRIGVFVCHCGTNIGGTIDVPRVTEYAKTLSNVVYADNKIYACSSDSQDKIKEKIKEHYLNRVVIASCTPRTHEQLFQETIREAGLNRYLFEMANIRDQCSWVHLDSPNNATEKAKDLIRMAVTKSRLLYPLERIPLKINHTGLVIGGGISGMNAALTLAEEGFEVYLVEKDEELGGFARNLHYTLNGSYVQKYVQSLIKKLKADARIKIFLESTIKHITGYVGNFKTTISNVYGEIEFNHGTIVVATGAVEYVPTEYFYGKDERVITQTELERRLIDDNNFEPKNIFMIQCVGSRTEERPYCSRVCCTKAVKNALKIKEKHQDTNVYILYRDVRTYGFAEEYYRKAREKGVIFIRYDEDRKPKITKEMRNGVELLQLSIYDPILKVELVLEGDLIVLSPAIVPSADNLRLAQMLKVPLNQDGFFLEAHVKLKPVDFSTEGIFLCGLAHGPKSIAESIAQAKAAASRACTILAKETLESEGTVASVNERRCTGCGTCVAVCAYKAIELDEQKKVAKVNSVLCKGCGACAASCRSSAIDLKGFTDEEIVSVVQSVFR